MKVTSITLRKNRKPEKMTRKETTDMSMPSNRSMLPTWQGTDQIKTKMTKMGLAL